MATRITATELSRKLSDVLSRVQYKGESFVIERNGQPVGVLGPPEAEKGPTWGELIRALDGKLTGDSSFADDLEWAQANQGQVEIRDWPD
jgi:prevent-host-death family protein